MGLDPQALFANLAEKEKIKGHHSPEGRAIRMLTRAMSGWLSAHLSAADVVVLCHQSMEDWLKTRLKIPSWSQRGFPELLAKAIEKGWITRGEALQLQRIHNRRPRLDVENSVPTKEEVEMTLEVCIQVVEKRW